MSIKKTLDYRIYKVELVVALYDYGTKTHTTPLDVVSFGADTVVLGATEKQLQIGESLTIVPQQTTSTTTVVAQRKTRKKGKATNAHALWTKAERKQLLELANNGMSKKQLAKTFGRTVSAIENQLFLLRKGN